MGLDGHAAERAVVVAPQNCTTLSKMLSTLKFVYVAGRHMEVSLLFCCQTRSLVLSDPSGISRHSRSGTNSLGVGVSPGIDVYEIGHSNRDVTSAHDERSAETT